MSMYEKHIEVLRSWMTGRSGERNEAVQAAIALMRAAEPKDAAAEREHCDRSARAEKWLPHRLQNCGLDHGQLSDLLLRERAAARAETHALYKENPMLCAPKDEAAEREHCITVIRVARPIMHGLVDTLMRERAAVRAEYEAKIKALEDQVEMLEGELRDLGDYDE